VRMRADSVLAPGCRLRKRSSRASMNFKRHRGPDGVWASDDQRVVLGHGGLAIIETGRLGDQPMREVSHRRVITFNGEIYNHAELRAELETLGCNFMTRSDT
jgi:asparagine synthase (glutamine-hydrolysing)